MSAGTTNYNRVTVTIDNDEYVFRSQEPGGYLETLAGLVEQRLQIIRQAHPNLPRHRAAVLAALYLADEAEKARQENAELLETLREAR